MPTLEQEVAIVDKPAFVGDAAGWLEQNSQRAADYFGKVEGAELSHVQIEGDTAQGPSACPSQGVRLRRGSKGSTAAG